MDKKELNLILEKGEGQFIEFKESLDKKFAKEIVAFANTSGGRIFLGITDKGKVKGIKITNKLKSIITDIAKNCDPFIQLNLEEFDSILIVHVLEGINKPYQCSNGFYMRIGPNSQKLNRNRILELSIKEGKIRFDEQICTHFAFEDFDDSKFEYYLKLAKISYYLDKESMLKNLKVLTDDGMTNAGVLLFAKEPFKYIGTSKIRCVLFIGDLRVDILDKKEVDKGIIGNIEFAVNYLKEHVPVRYEIKGIRRLEYPQFPEEAYREAIVNAVIHRDYFENGEVAVEKLKTKIIINNPGGLVHSLQKKDFGNSSRPRNKLLADLLSKTIFMEKVGTGIRRIKNYCIENNNNVDFKFDDYDFFVEMTPLKRIREETTQKTTQKIIASIEENPGITRRELAEAIGLTEDGIKYHLKKMQEQRIIERIGPDKGGYWQVLGE